MVVITDPDSGMKVKKSFTVSVIATDQSSQIIRVALDECRGGVCTEIASDSASPWDFAVTLGKGKRTLRAVAVDAAGHAGFSDYVTVQVGKKKKKK